jgi:tRNA-uridine 2-sulfurtransferase
MKALSLFSGGLDSILATRLIVEQGIKVEGFYFRTVFWDSLKDRSKALLLGELARQAGCRLHVIDVSKDFFDIVRKPAHGYGKNLNPCIDCKIFLLKKAKEHMQKYRASFVVTGEVLDQRPMSQTYDIINMIEKKACLRGQIVRPLSAGFFEQSIPEKKGWVKPRDFVSIKGRTRTVQLDLAKSLGIKKFLNPTGGCLLTDKGFSKRVRYLMRATCDFNETNIEILKFGRFFRLPKGVRLVAGRNEDENSRLLRIKNSKDYYLYPEDMAGPVGIILGNPSHEDIETSAGIIARFSKPGKTKNRIIICKNSSRHLSERIVSEPASDTLLEKTRIK